MSKPEIWVDGKFVAWDRVTVHVLSHSLQRGSTVFESLSCEQTSRGPAIFRLGTHFDRFLESARLTRMKIPFSRNELAEAAKETVRRSGLSRCCIRPLAYYVGEEYEVLPKHSVVQVIIAVGPPIEAPNSLRAKVSSYRKLHPQTVPVAAKVAANYLSGMLAKFEAFEHGFDGAILLDCDGNIAEGPTESLFIVKGGILKTAPLETVLAGITRDCVMRIARDLGYAVVEDKVSLAGLYEADEVFVTGTSAGVIPVVQVDDRVLHRGQPGKTTQKLRETYFNAAHGEDRKYEEWLTYVRGGKAR